MSENTDTNITLARGIILARLDSALPEGASGGGRNESPRPLQTTTSPWQCRVVCTVVQQGWLSIMNDVHTLYSSEGC